MNLIPSQSSRPPSRQRAAVLSFLRWTAILTVGFLLAVTGYYLYVNVINRPPAEVYVVARGTAVSAVYGTVTINANYSLTLFSQNSGYLHLAPDLGTTITSQGGRVKKDQLFGTIVDEPGQRQLNAARTDHEAALARQRLGPPSLSPLSSAQAQVDALNKLPGNMVPKVQRDSAQNDLNRLKSVVDAEKLELQHAVDITGSTLKAAEDQLKRAEIRAPFDGILTLQNFNDNAFVLPNQALFTVASAETYVSGQVNEEDVGQLRVGMKAEVRLYAYGGATLVATVTAVLPSPDANSSRYTVTLNLDKPPDNLMFGLTGEMNIILGRKENALIIPARALNIDQVLIVDDGVIAPRTVRAGFKSLEYAEILEGLGEGDQVVVSDQDAFQPGQRVRPVKVNQAKPKK